MVFLEEVSLINDLKRIKDFPGDSDGKASAYNAGDQGSIPGSGRSPGEGNGNPLQYCCLEKSMDGGTWWAIVPGATKSQTRLIDFTFHFQENKRMQECCLLLVKRSNNRRDNVFVVKTPSSLLMILTSSSPWPDQLEPKGRWCWPFLTL